MKKKRDPKKIWRNKADALFQIVGLLANPPCMMSGSSQRSDSCTGRAQTIHHYHRKSESNFLRYNFLNGIPICFSCHALWHLRGDPDFLHDLDKKLGEKRVEYLRKNKTRYVHTTLGFYQKAVREMEKMIKK